MEYLEESLRSSTSRLSKEGKLSRLGGGLALQICKRENPALFTRYQKARTLSDKLKSDIQKKYGGKGLQAAKKATRK